MGADVLAAGVSTVGGMPGSSGSGAASTVVSSGSVGAGHVGGGGSAASVKRSTKGIDYSKFSNIENSDDEDQVNRGKPLQADIISEDCCNDHNDGSSGENSAGVSCERCQAQGAEDYEGFFVCANCFIAINSG